MSSALSVGAGAEAQGFVETESAIVLVRSGFVGAPSVLTAVEIGAGALTTSAELNVEGETPPRAAMAVVGQRLALFQNTPSGTALQVHPLAGGAPSALSVEVPGVQSSGDRIDAAHFDGSFALVPGAEPDSAQSGVIIDWLREAGPAVAAELPADLPNLARLGDRWLGWGAERSVVFRVGPAGTVHRRRDTVVGSLPLRRSWRLPHGDPLGAGDIVRARSTSRDALRAPRPLRSTELDHCRHRLVAASPIS